MSSLRRIQSSRSNGARSKGPSTPAGKLHSSLNAIRHGLCAKCVVVEGESRENFLLLLQQHVDRLRPADEVEFGMIEEMCASYWRQRRAWSLETGMFNKQMAIQPDGGMMERMVVAFDTLAASPSLSLLHRYETRLHLTYQRALRTLILLRTIDLPNEDPPEGRPTLGDPSPIPEHSPPPCAGGSQSWLQPAPQPALAPRTPKLQPPGTPPPAPSPPNPPLLAPRTPKLQPPATPPPAPPTRPPALAPRRPPPQPPHRPLPLAAGRRAPKQKKPESPPEAPNHLKAGMLIHVDRPSRPPLIAPDSRG